MWISGRAETLEVTSRHFSQSEMWTRSRSRGKEFKDNHDSASSSSSVYSHLQIPLADSSMNFKSPFQIYFGAILSNWARQALLMVNESFAFETI